MCSSDCKKNERLYSLLVLLTNYVKKICVSLTHLQISAGSSKCRQPAGNNPPLKRETLYYSLIMQFTWVSQLSYRSPFRHCSSSSYWSISNSASIHSVPAFGHMDTKPKVPTTAPGNK